MSHRQEGLWISFCIRQDAIKGFWVGINTHKFSFYQDPSGCFVRIARMDAERQVGLSSRKKMIRSRIMEMFEGRGEDLFRECMRHVAEIRQG